MRFLLPVWGTELAGHKLLYPLGHHCLNMDEAFLIFFYYRQPIPRKNNNPVLVCLSVFCYFFTHETFNGPQLQYTAGHCSFQQMLLNQE